MFKSTASSHWERRKGGEAAPLPLFGRGNRVKRSLGTKFWWVRPLLRLFLICTFAHLHIGTSAQDTSRLRISLLTCTPGEELYSTFGHSAYRVIDSNSVTDIVYNYGTFNFDDEGFYLKFVRGKLLYYVSLQEFNGVYGFKEDYKRQNRGITEQVLNLTAAEKISIRHFLNENAKPENKYYKYDFFFDNCTTRLRDILKKQHDSAFCQKPVMPKGTRFRQAIHMYLDKNGQPWSKLGIDILMGIPTDAVMTTEQMQFLPDNLMLSLDSSDHKMVLSKQNLYPINEMLNKNSPFTPKLVFWLLLIVIVLLGLVKHKIAEAFLQGFDGILFFCTGILGIIIILMWTCTDHTMCRNNLNLIWAFPTHAVMAFFVNSEKSWVKKYFAFTAISLILMLIAWSFLPQQLNSALIPVLLLLVYRSVKKNAL